MKAARRSPAGTLSGSPSHSSRTQASARRTSAGCSATWAAMYSTAARERSRPTVRAASSATRGASVRRACSASSRSTSCSKMWSRHALAAVPRAASSSTTASRTSGSVSACSRRATVRVTLPESPSGMTRSRRAARARAAAASLRSACRNTSRRVASSVTCPSQ